MKKKFSHTMGSSGGEEVIIYRCAAEKNFWSNSSSSQQHLLSHASLILAKNNYSDYSLNKDTSHIQGQGLLTCKYQHIHYFKIVTRFLVYNHFI